MPLKLGKSGFFGGKGSGSNAQMSTLVVARAEPSQQDMRNKENTAPSDSSVVQTPGKVIPLKRRALSLDVNTRFFNKNKTGKTNSGAKSAWYRSLLVKLGQTFKTNQRQDENFGSEQETITELETDDVGPDAKDDSLIIQQIVAGGQVSEPRDIPIFHMTKPHNCDDSIFDICAQTPRHFESEAEILGKVGRFTIIRERKDFDTTIFDRCHCATKPCPYAQCGTHPPAQETTFPVSSSAMSPEYPQPRTRSSYKANSSSYSLPISIQPAHSPPHAPAIVAKPQKRRFSLQQSALAQQKLQRQSSTSSSKSKRTSRGVFQCEQYSSSWSTLPTASSRRRSVQSTASDQQSMHEKSNSFSSSHSISNSAHEPTPTPYTINNHTKNNTNYSSHTAKISQSVSYPNLQQLHHPIDETRSNSFSSTNDTDKQTRFLVSKIPSTFLQSLQSNAQPTAGSTPHTTISSYSGRKFEVEWASDLASLSPSSTMSSVVSYNASPSTSLTSTNTTASMLAQYGNGGGSKSSTLSSKCGRKFEVTVLDS